MRFIPRASLWLALLAAPAAITTSCTSEKKEDPQPTTGSLSGTVSPAGSISTVTATDAGGLTFLATPDATTGAFSIDKLAPGTYNLTFAPGAGYLKPAARTVAITAGAMASAGTIQVVVLPQGTVAGIISPADAVTRVDLVATDGTVQSAVPNTASGSFRFSGLALSNYTVRFAVATGFNPQAERQVGPDASQPTVNLGTVQFQSNGIPRGTMTWTQNGLTYSADSFTGRPSGSSFEVEALSTSNQETTRLTLHLDSYYDIARTYPMFALSNYATLVKFQNGLPGPTFHTAYNTTGQSSSLTITAVDTNAHSVTGTFGFVAQPVGGTPVTITNGSFTLRY